MGKKSQSLRWVTVAFACCLAVLLHLALTQYATKMTVTYCDGGTAVQSGPAPDPIIQTYSSIGDTFCEFATPGRRGIASFYEQAGIFPRGNISFAFAVGGGVVLPFLLLCVALYLLLDTTRQRTRAMAGIGLCILAMLVSAPILLVSPLSPYVVSEYGWGDFLRESLAIQALVILGAPAAVFFGLGIWLWRTRSAR